MDSTTIDFVARDHSKVRIRKIVGISSELDKLRNGAQKGRKKNSFLLGRSFLPQLTIDVQHCMSSRARLFTLFLCLSCCKASEVSVMSVENIERLSVRKRNQAKIRIPSVKALGLSVYAHEKN